MSPREAEYGGGRGFDENTRNQSILDGVSRVYSGAKEQMKTWEALKAADEGKKIRRKCWMKGVYSIKKENSWAGNTALMTHYKLSNKFGTCDNVRLERLEWDDIFADDWEIYEEEE